MAGNEEPDIDAGTGVHASHSLWREERSVVAGAVEFARRRLADRHRCHYVKVRVAVLRYPDGQMAIFHGPRKLATYDVFGKEIKLDNTVVA